VKADDDRKEFSSLWDNLPKDGKITLNKFEEYYNDVSSAVEFDEQFYNILHGSFNAVSNNKS